ncbi:MAG: alpha/beta hydrolase [Planctomycetota bacterium]|nr:alpha/beta hydrolase [Planctomycetota bacterium]
MTLPADPPPSPDVPDAPTAPPAAPPKRPKRTLKRLATRMLIYLAIGYAGWCATLYFFQDTMLFPGVGLPVGMKASTLSPAIEELRRPIPGGDGAEAAAWFVPAPGASADHPAPLVVYCHGNYETLDNQGWMIDLFRGLGCSVLLPEYRGYGRAGGKPSQAGIREDTLGFLHDVKARPEVDPSRVFYYGRSLGGGVAADLASVERPNAVVIESSFTSVATMAWKYFAPPLLAKNPYRTDRVLPALGIPVLLFHGSRDDTIPVAHARRMHAMTPGSELCEYDCGHDDPPSVSFAQDHRAKLEAFLKRAGVLR